MLGVYVYMSEKDLLFHSVAETNPAAESKKVD
jgi:hypothetical protein